MYTKYKIVPLCPYHFVHTILSNTILFVYHFVRIILSATILSGHHENISLGTAQPFVNVREAIFHIHLKAEVSIPLSQLCILHIPLSYFHKIYKFLPYFRQIYKFFPLFSAKFINSQYLCSIYVFFA